MTIMFSKKLERGKLSTDQNNYIILYINNPKLIKKNVGLARVKYTEEYTYVCSMLLLTTLKN